MKKLNLLVAFALCFTLGLGATLLMSSITSVYANTGQTLESLNYPVYRNEIVQEQNINDTIKFELDSTNILSMQQYSDENGKFKMNIDSGLNIDTSKYEFKGDSFVLDAEQSEIFYTEIQKYAFEDAVKTQQISAEEIAKTLGTDLANVEKMSVDEVVIEYSNQLDSNVNIRTTQDENINKEPRYIEELHGSIVEMCRYMPHKIIK